MTFITKPSKYESINFFKSKAVFAVAFYSFTLAGNLVSTGALTYCSPNFLELEVPARSTSRFSNLENRQVSIS